MWLQEEMRIYAQNNECVMRNKRIINRRPSGIREWKLGTYHYKILLDLIIWKTTMFSTNYYFVGQVAHIDKFAHKAF